jgi:hypothetical protein
VTSAPVLEPFYLDASKAHATITPRNLERVGASGAILYAGCDDTAKNCTAEEVHALLAGGYRVGLVIENGTTDMRMGTAVGDYLGWHLAKAAAELGYDLAHCVGYTSADWNSRTQIDLDGIVAAMRAFGRHVPHPGIYGNSYAIAECFAAGVAEFGWQSNSTSFSIGSSPLACLYQRYNDPRAGGLVADVNDVNPERELGLMGGTPTMALTPDVQAAFDAAAADRAHYAESLRLGDVDATGRPKPPAEQTHPDNLHTIRLELEALAKTCVEAIAANQTAVLEAIKTAAPTLSGDFTMTGSGTVSTP